MKRMWKCIIEFFKIEGPKTEEEIAYWCVK